MFDSGEFWNEKYNKSLALPHLQLESSNTSENSYYLSIVLNEEKIAEDALWDVLKGIITNDYELTNYDLLGYFD